MGVKKKNRAIVITSVGACIIIIAFTLFLILIVIPAM